MDKSFRSQYARRALRLESLEARQMMAADTAVGFHSPGDHASVAAFAPATPGSDTGIANINHAPFNDIGNSNGISTINQGGTNHLGGPGEQFGLEPDLSITETDSAGGSSVTNAHGNVKPGQTLTYTVVVTNSGPGNASATELTDLLPGNFTDTGWTATETGGATSTGLIDQMEVTLPAGSSITYTITGKVSSSAKGILTNTAALTPPGGAAISATDEDIVHVPNRVNFGNENSTKGWWLADSSEASALASVESTANQHDQHIAATDEAVSDFDLADLYV